VAATRTIDGGRRSAATSRTRARTVGMTTKPWVGAAAALVRAPTAEIPPTTPAPTPATEAGGMTGRPAVRAAVGVPAMAPVVATIRRRETATGGVVPGRVVARVRRAAVTVPTTTDRPRSKAAHPCRSRNRPPAGRARPRPPAALARRPVRRALPPNPTTRLPPRPPALRAALRTRRPNLLRSSTTRRAPVAAAIPRAGRALQEIPKFIRDLRSRLGLRT
jgi:hypothetical protein